MSNVTKNMIALGKFTEAKKQLFSIVSENDQKNVLRDILIEVGYEDESICAYAFICFLLSGRNDFEYHRLASMVLDSGICYLVGAYNASYYHHLKALELDPNNVDLHEGLLFFYDVPEQVINNLEARTIAQNILSMRPKNMRSLAVLNEAVDTNLDSSADNSPSLIQENPQKNLGRLILTGRIILAQKHAAEIVFDEWYDIVLQTCIDQKNICIYTFIWALLQENELPEYHRLAAEILSLICCDIRGFKEAIFFHIHRAATLAPDNMEVQEKLLGLYVPGGLSFDSQEAQEIAKRVLTQKPESELAQKVLKTL